MPSRLKRYQQTGQLHYITFTCYRRLKHLEADSARDIFEQILERVRRWYRFQVVGYVVMPEHVHLLLSEPERSNLATALQVLKRRSSRRLRKPGDRRVWQKRYYDFNVFSARKRTEKLRYMHRNPVKRGLVERPEDWKWSSYQHYLTGTEGVVEIESHWLARQRERTGIVPKLKYTKLKEPAD
jgi:putative transposase